MILDYINAAMRKAHYEIIEDCGSYYGEIIGFDGVYANSETLEACREELLQVLEEWLIFRISRNLVVPIVDGHSLKVEKVA